MRAGVGRKDGGEERERLRGKDIPERPVAGEGTSSYQRAYAPGRLDVKQKAS